MVSAAIEEIFHDIQMVFLCCHVQRSEAILKKHHHQQACLVYQLTGNRELTRTSPEASDNTIDVVLRLENASSFERENLIYGYKLNKPKARHNNNQQTVQRWKSMKKLKTSQWISQTGGWTAWTPGSSSPPNKTKNFPINRLETKITRISFLLILSQRAKDEINDENKVCSYSI